MFIQPPRPGKDWEGVKSATSFGSQCYQIDVITSLMLGSEDCLYLNVFTPRVIFNGFVKISGPRFILKNSNLFVSFEERYGQGEKASSYVLDTWRGFSKWKF